MKIIVNKSELTNLQNRFDKVVEEVNKINAIEPLKSKQIMERLEVLKDQIFIKYKVFQGNFEITISEELINDYVGLYTGLIIKAVPVINVLEPIVKILTDYIEDVKADVEVFTTKYKSTFVPETDSDEDPSPL